MFCKIYITGYCSNHTNLHAIKNQGKYGREPGRFYGFETGRVPQGLPADILTVVYMSAIQATSKIAATIDLYLLFILRFFFPEKP